MLLTLVACKQRCSAGICAASTVVVIYINDLDENMDGKFVDDTKIVGMVDSEEGYVRIQKDLDQLSQWAEEWWLEFNSDKCETIEYRSRDVLLRLFRMLVRPLLKYYVQFWLPCYKEDITKLERMQKRGGGAGCLKHTKVDKFPGPDQVYPSTLWNAREEIAGPLAEKFVSSIATGKVPEDWRLANVVPLFKKGGGMISMFAGDTKIGGIVDSKKGYSEYNGFLIRLDKLGLFTLEHRRLRGNLVKVYKIMRGIDKVNSKVLFPRVGEFKTRGHFLSQLSSRSNDSTLRNPRANFIVSKVNKDVKSPVSVTASQGCVICEFVLQEIDRYLQKNSTEEMIVNIVEKVCSLLPATVKSECNDFVEQYGKAVVDLLAQELNPALVCRVIGLCSNTQRVVTEDVKPNQLKTGPLCEICITVIRYLDAALEKNSTEQEIENALDKVCSMLPTTVRDE
eukprot:g45495.t1